MKLGQRTIENTVYRGKREDEAEEFDDCMQESAYLIHVTDSIFCILLTCVYIYLCQ